MLTEPKVAERVFGKIEPVQACRKVSDPERAPGIRCESKRGLVIICRRIFGIVAVVNELMKGIAESEESFADRGKPDLPFPVFADRCDLRLRRFFGIGNFRREIREDAFLLIINAYSGLVETHPDLPIAGGINAPDGIVADALRIRGLVPEHTDRADTRIEKEQSCSEGADPHEAGRALGDCGHRRVRKSIFNRIAPE